MLQDGRTIVALVTPEGRGGLAVVRLSGGDALTIARQLTPAAALDEPLTSHLARLSFLRWPGGSDDELLDQAVVLPMLAPSSFTGETTVEFHCHGGTMPARQVVAACLAAGARAAAPGEFTRRAFLNGRLSLTQAEAVADLIASEHVIGARAALAQLRGGMKSRLAELEVPLMRLLAELEGSLEFAEFDGVDPNPDTIRETLTSAVDQLDRLLDLAPAGRRLRDGVQVVLVGEPNAGKSSLFNALVAEDRAIVDDEPGTTRDTVSGALDLDGLRFILHDTAGIRGDVGVVEAKGIARTHACIEAADLVLRLHPVDSPGPPPPLDIPPEVCEIPVATKADLGDITNHEGMPTSSVTGLGITALREAMLDAARDAALEEAAGAGVVLNQRHQDRLRVCRDGLAQCVSAADAGAEVVAGLLSAALQDLGNVSGRVLSEQALGEIFSRFCVGK